jgi:hypothetical protein
VIPIAPLASGAVAGYFDWAMACVMCELPPPISNW